MNGENIVCFAKDWSEDPTSNNHVMKLLARDNEVLWLNSIAMRTPDFRSGRDLSKIGRKLASFMRGPVTVEKRLSVYTPIVLPFPHSRAAVMMNRQILKTTVSLLRRRQGMRDFQLWTFLPTAVEYVGKLGESLVVYYCTDEFSQFSYLDGGKMARMERELCQRADIVFTTSRTLHEKKRALNPETHLASHGVDHAHFSTAMEERTKVAEEIAALPRPILGFFGLIHDWIDLDLFAYIAELRPTWSIVLIGKAAVDVSKLKKYPNIHLLGRKPYEELPRYCKGFDIGLIPFVLNELTRNVNPIKLREYLSAGLPVVSTNLPEIGYYSDTCRIATDHAGFLAACDAALGEDSLEERRRRSRAMAKETWEAKVMELGEHVKRVKRERSGGRTT
ncbi:MAG: glycosyltransferase [Deltaproteobacteria bacterium]|nr:glycosyltransferase [Deltaproteobacteria bacterium]